MMTALVEPPHNCDRELHADPSFDPHHCKPEVWTCSCGKRYEHVCDEAEGCFWALVT